MILPLLRRGLRHHRWLIAVMLLCMIGFQVLIITIAQMIDQGPGVGQLLAQLPKFVRDLITTQVGDISFPTFAAFGYEHPVTMGGAIAYIVYVCTIPAGERDSGLADLLLARPLTRRQYLGATVVHLNLAALAVPGFLLLGTVIGLSFADSEHALPWFRYVPAAVGLWSLLLAWGGIALLLGCASKRRGTAVMQIVTIILAAFLIHVLGQFASALEWVCWLSPFAYFHAIGLAMKPEGGNLDVYVLLGIAALSIGAAFFVFERRDL